MNTYWQVIDAQLDRVETEQLDTYDKLADVFASDPSVTGCRAFFGGGGGNRSLLSSLQIAGWKIVWMMASYYYCVQHPTTGDVISYIEGDIIKGDVRGDDA